MKYYGFLPIHILLFWYKDAPIALFGFFSSVNTAFFQLFSLPLLLKTFFKPLKNEYREGLVKFSIAMGIVVKSVLIFIDLIIFSLVLFIEVMSFAGFLFFPIATILILFL